jgi:hypothetical protein
MAATARTVPSLRAALETLLPAPPVPVALSAAAGDATLRALDAYEVLLCPTVRGRAVWEAVPAAVAVVESPNRWGLRERPPQRRLSVVVGRRGPGNGGETPAAAVVVAEGPWIVWRADTPEAAATVADGEREFEAEATSRARSLLKQLRQIRGVEAAFGIAESPVFVITVPREPAAAATALSEAADGIAVDAPVIPGVPGALRISVGAAEENSLRAFADAARDILVSQVGSEVGRWA